MVHGPRIAMRNRYSVGVGIVLAVLAAFVAVHALVSGDGERTLGIDAMPPRWPLPEFAVPDAAGELEGDANIEQTDCTTAGLPCPPEDRVVPACSVHVAEAIRVCDLFDRPLVLSFFFLGGACTRQEDVVNEAYRRFHGRVNFLSVDTLDERSELRNAVRERNWSMPVGYDRDGAVAALYSIGLCPTFAFAYPGGTLEAATVGALTPAQLDRRVRALLRSSSSAEFS
jgi:hypothetical protein